MWALLVFAWVGWALFVAAALVLRRRMTLVADAEHELRGAATAIGLGAGASPPVRLQAERMTAALADLARARGARPAGAVDLDAGRLAQVLTNVSANAAEHGVGPVEVAGSRAAGVMRLEVSNEERPGRRAAAAAGRGRGLRIARRAAGELGGRVSLVRVDGVTRAVIELPAGEAERGEATKPGREGGDRGGDDLDRGGAGGEDLGRGGGDHGGDDRGRDGRPRAA